MNYNIRPRFKIPSRELKVEHQVGYEVDIQQISGNGLLFVYFDSDTDKVTESRGFLLSGSFWDIVANLVHFYRQPFTVSGTPCPSFMRIR